MIFKLSANLNAFRSFCQVSEGLLSGSQWIDGLNWYYYCWHVRYQHYNFYVLFDGSCEANLLLSLLAVKLCIFYIIRLEIIKKNIIISLPGYMARSNIAPRQKVDGRKTDGRQRLTRYIYHNN